MEHLISLFVRSIFVDNMIFAFFLGIGDRLASLQRDYDKAFNQLSDGNGSVAVSYTHLERGKGKRKGFERQSGGVPKAIRPPANGIRQQENKL